MGFSSEEEPQRILTDDRHALILEELMASGRLETAALCEKLGVSEMTIRRDLMRLEADGALRRVRGGATRVASGSYEPPFLVRARLRNEAKQAIAEAVVAQVTDGQTVLLDGGTTGLAVAEALGGRVTTVCPLSLRATIVLAGWPNVRLLLPGGFVRPGEQTFIGPPAVRSIEEHVFDVFIMTASGVTLSAGITEWNEDDAAVKRAARASAGRCIVACDSSKFGQSAFSRVANVDDVDLIVTDNGLAPTIRQQLEDLGAELLCVDPVPVAAPRGHGMGEGGASP